MLKFNFRQGGQFDLKNVEIHTEGDLKGYITGMLQTSYSDNEHDFLYRIQDLKNGDSYKLVSVDYGYKINLNEQHFEDIEKIIFKSCVLTKRSVREILKDDTVFNIMKRTVADESNVIQQQVMEKMDCDKCDAKIMIDNVLNSNDDIQKLIMDLI